VVIDLDKLDPSELPGEVAVSALTMAELAAGPHATRDPNERDGQSPDGAALSPAQHLARESDSSRHARHVACRHEGRADPASAPPGRIACRPGCGSTGP
jgi:hypothetical protein